MPLRLVLASELKVPAAPLAAGVVCRGRGQQLELLLVHVREERRWELPRSSVGPDEPGELAAIRGVRAETGYPAKVLAFLGSVMHTCEPAGWSALNYWLLRPIGPRTSGSYPNGGWFSMESAAALLEDQTDGAAVSLVEHLVHPAREFGAY